MSGGHFDYKSTSIERLGEEMMAEAYKRSGPSIVEYYFGETETIPPESPRVLEITRECANILQVVGKLAHAVEWYYSGDYGEETLEECFTEYRRGIKDKRKGK